MDASAALTPRPPGYKGIVVAVGGPPHSGKSVFLAALYQHLRARPIGFFVERACPDGEGMWSTEAPPALVRQIRRKGVYSPEFVAAKMTSIENLGRAFPLVLVDLGGKLADDNALYLARSTHLVILAALAEEVERWRAFAAAVGCPTLAVFRSRLVRRSDGTLDDAAQSTLDLGAVPVRGELLNLDREGSDRPYRDVVAAFADWLVALATKVVPG